MGQKTSGRPVRPARFLQIRQRVRKRAALRGGNGGSAGGSRYITTEKNTRRSLCRGAEGWHHARGYGDTKGG